MRHAAALLLLAACAGDGPNPGDARNGLAVDFAVDDAPDGLDELVLRVREVVFDGVGPSGDASIATEVGREFAIWGRGAEPSDIVIELETGRWTDVTVELVLGALEPSPALRATGALPDGRSFVWEVRPEVSFTARGTFELGDGVDPALIFEFEVEDWYEVLTETDPSGVSPVPINPDENDDVYEQLLRELRSSTSAEFPGSDDDGSN